MTTDSPRTNDVLTSRVSRRNRFMWGLGGFADATIVYGVFSLINTIYINALAVNAVLVGIAVAIPRFLDVLSDPVVGHLSDNTRSRWGRRRPWFLAGVLICAAVSLLLWNPPLSHDAASPHAGITGTAAGADASNPGQFSVGDHREEAGSTAQESWWGTAANAIQAEWGTFLYLTIMITLLMAVGYTLFNVPHYAMGYEMTTDYNERTHLFKWRFISYAAAGFMTPWLLPLAMALEGDQAQTLRGSQGVFPVAVMLALVILATGLPSLFCKEGVTARRTVTKIRFRDALRLTLHNRPFVLLLSGNLIARFGMAITGIFFYYVFVYHIGKGEQLAGAALLALFFNVINIANFLAMAPIASLSARIGKKTTLIMMLVMSAVAYASLLVTFTNSDDSFIRHTISLGPFSIPLFVQWPSILTGVLIGVFTNTIPMIANSMIADVCDYDELQTGKRREGFYGAVYTSTEKIAWSVSAAFQGVLLVASGFNASLTLQSPETIRYWFLALVITQPLGFLIGVAIVAFYPLTRAQVEKIRAELEMRNPAVPEQEPAK